MNKELINNLFNKEKKKVELVFENSNTILTGGLDKEDDKLNIEIFLDKDNDKDKIDNLLSTKNLTNQYFYDKNGKSNIDTYNGENLLIKGNNLVVLHTLKERFTNKIDVIYIDPPYYFNKTKSKDSFAYNSNFELSTWLVFMKNRLEIAKELLSDEGVVFISMNEDGTSHLKLLCDGIFGINNFMNNLIWKNTIKRHGNNILSEHEYILCYSKNKNNQKLWTTENTEARELYDFFINIKKENNVKENIEKLLKEFVKNEKYDRVSSYVFYDIETDELIRSGDMSGKNKFNLYHPNGKICKSSINGWNTNEQKMLEKVKNKEILFGIDETTVPRLKIFLKDRILEDKLRSVINILGDGEGEKLKKNFNIEFQNPKPINLLKKLINIFNKNINLLDFFGGSGTTGQAIMDLNKEDNGNRKFILVEQMDYIETISSERLKRCIQKYDYDESFIYCELEESNIKELKRKIKSVNSKEELIDLIELNFKDKKDEIYSYMNLIEQIAPKKANKLYEMIRMLFLYYIPLDEDYVSFNGNNTFSNSLLTINK